MVIQIFQSFLVVYPCLKITVFIRFPSVDVFLLSAARSSLLFSFFLWLWKLALEKGKPMMMLVLSGGSSFSACLFSLFSFVHFVCVLGTKAKLGTLAFYSFLFLVCAFGPPSLGTPGLFPFLVLPSVLFSALSFYLLPVYPPVYFSSSLLSEKKQGKKVCYFWFVLLSLFSAVHGFFSPPFRFPCDLSFFGFYSQRTIRFFQPLIAGVMVAVGVCWRRWTWHPQIAPFWCLMFICVLALEVLKVL